LDDPFVDLDDPFVDFFGSNDATQRIAIIAIDYLCYIYTSMHLLK